MIGPKKDGKPFEFVEAKVPFYPAGEKCTTREPLNRMRSRSPEESIGHYQHPADFGLSSCERTELRGKPIAMNWDERGRLWVCVPVNASAKTIHLLGGVSAVYRTQG